MLGVQVSVCGILGLRLRAEGLWLRVQDLCFRVKSLEVRRGGGFMLFNLGFRVEGLEFRVWV